MGRERVAAQVLVKLGSGSDGWFRLAGEYTPDVDEIVGDHAEADPACHATITPVPTAVESVATLQHADAPFTAGPPFLPVAEPWFLLFPLPFGALCVEQTTVTPI